MTPADRIVAPKPPPPVPAPAPRVSADQADRRATPARASSGPAGSQPALQSAAARTRTTVTAARASQQHAHKVSASPRSSRDEIQRANADAGAAADEAQRTVAQEVTLARTLLTPSYAERYVDDLANDEGDDREARSIVRAGIDKAFGAETTIGVRAAVDVSRASSEKADASSLSPSTRAAVEKARQAQHTYQERLSDRPGHSDTYDTHVVETAKREARSRWADVESAVGNDLSQSENSLPENLVGSRACTIKANQLREIARGNPNFEQAVDNAVNRDEGRRVAHEVERVYKAQGHRVAAEVLYERTREQPPAVAREAVLAARPTLDAIGADLAADAPRADKSKGVVGGFQTDPYYVAVKHLSVVAYDAGTAQGGDEAVGVLADSIARHVDRKDLGGLDEAFGSAVRRTGASTLSIAVSERLQRDIDAGSGRKADQADDILQNVSGGLQGLREDNETKTGNLMRDDVFRLLTGHSAIASSEGHRQMAREQYLHGHPDKKREYERKIKEFDQQGEATLRAAVSLHALPPSLRELEHARQLKQRKAEFDADPNTAGIIKGSERAGQELNRIIDAGGDGWQRTLDWAGVAGEGSGLPEAIGTAYLDNRVGKAVGLVGGDPPDIDAAKQTLRDLKGKGWLFGVEDRARFDRSIDRLEKTFFVASTDDVKLVAKEVKVLDRALNDIDLGPGTESGQRLRGAVVILSGAGVAYRLRDVIEGDAKVGEGLSLIADSAGLAKGVGDLLRSDKFLGSVGWKTFGKVVAPAGIVADVFTLGDQLGAGQWAQAGFTVGQIGGGALGAWSLAAGSTGIGLLGAGIVIVAAFGAQYWQKREFANALENGGTEAYLVNLGFNEEVARELRNADGDGNSAIPVLAELARSYGYDLDQEADAKMFIAYVNRFGASEDGLKRLHDLVVHAHKVERDDGEVRLASTDREQRPAERNISGPRYVIESVEGLRWWMENSNFSANPANLPPNLRPQGDTARTRAA